jgi:hypothetical protein
LEKQPAFGNSTCPKEIKAIYHVFRMGGSSANRSLLLPGSWAPTLPGPCETGMLSSLMVTFQRDGSQILERKWFWAVNLKLG